MDGGAERTDYRHHVQSQFFMSDHHNDPSSPTTTPQSPPPSSAFERFRQAVLSVAVLDGDENPDRRAQKELKTRQRNEEIRLECERIKTDLLATSMSV